MRAICIVALAGLCACQSESELRYLSSVETRTDGVALSMDGTASIAAMAGTTCTLDARFGCPIGDQDLPTEQEQVLDHYDGATLATSEDTLYFLTGGHWDHAADVSIPQLRQARLTRRGLLSLHSNATECILSDAGIEVAVDGALCGDDVTVEVDRRGSLIALTPTGAWRASVDGVSRLSKTANRASADAELGQVYLATTGARAVEALDDVGARVWTSDLDGPVRDLVTRGDRQEVLVLSESANGLGLVTRLDGSSGEVLDSYEIPSADGRIEASGNGRVMAFVTDTEVHHFEVVVEGEASLPDTKDPECIDLPTRAGQSMGLD